VILEESIIHLIKGAAWVAENFPDDSRLARRLLVAAGALLGAHSFLARWAGRDSIFLFQGLCLVAGILCGFLGLSVLFRRAVWFVRRKQVQV
jgi:hypothetical protein